MRVCVFVDVSVHTEVQLTNTTRFFTVMILEPQKADWPICTSTWQILIKTQFCNNVPATLRSQCCKKFSLQSCSSLWCIAVLNTQPASLRAELHQQMNNAVQCSDSYWNVCTSADPGIPLFFRRLAAPDSLDKSELCWLLWNGLTHFHSKLYTMAGKVTSHCYISSD